MSDPADADDALAQLAQSLLHRARTGVLSTLSAQNEGWPFGSLTPYAVARDGALILVMSDLAEHTRNVRADGRASLFVQDATGANNPQSEGRVCVLGRVSELAGEVRDDARARYVARHPEGYGYLAKLDFRVYALAPERVRMIQGFGRIGWLPANAITRDPANDALASARDDVLAHMNQDHSEVLGLYCEAFRGKSAARARMVGLDAWGFDVRDEDTGELYRFDFDERLTDPNAVRVAVVAMARAARAKLGRVKA